MKKIMSDKSFWLILGISIISLIVLTIGVVFLTKKNATEFYSAGYIINSTATKSDKYYFNDNTVYKENIFNEYVFKDVDNKEVSTGKDNFIHYLDNSLSFMQNGVILDLDNFNENVVPYYNITDKSIVKYNNGGYYVETADKTLVFGNFLGRISDNKYIIVGKDIKVKLAGNDEAVSGDYFEILFVENGIVKVENQEGSYQTVSEGTIVYVGDNIKINLGDETVNYGEETKLTLSELTINGDENIDIKPSDGNISKEEENGNGEGGTPGNGNGNNPGNGNGTTGEGDGETNTILKKEVSVSLIEATSNINSIKAKFQVIDTAQAIKGNLVLTLVNTTTGDTVYKKILVNTPEEQTVVVSSLASDCNYVMTIIDENNDTGTQYFQKSFRTDSLNLKLKREMVTETSLTYAIDFGIDSDVVATDITLFDTENNEIGNYTVAKEDNDKVTFEGLEANTLYRVVVDNVVIKNVQYDQLYRSETSDFTLKNKPTLGEVVVKTNNDAKTFTLSMNNVTDEDKAIVKYTYQIFKSEDLTEDTMTTATPVYSFSRSSLEDEILKLDEAKNLYGNTDYRFKIVVQYYDNYRYNEIETMLSDSFNVVGKPTVTFEASEIDFNRIAGRVIIDDADCTIPFDGRECNNNVNNFVIRYYGGTSVTRNVVEDVTVDSENMTLSFDLIGLQENTVYTFEVFADIDLRNEQGLVSGQYIGGFNVSTTGIEALMMQNWKKNGYSFENPISVNTEMVSTTPDNSSIDNLASIKFNLYSGDVSKTIEYATPIASYTVSGNIKEEFYNKTFAINSSTFEYEDKETSEMLKVENLDVLKELSGGRLSRYYTIQVTDAYDATHTNEFVIMNNVYVYETPSILLLEDEVTAPEIVVEEITNIQTNANTKDDKGPYADYGISYIADLSDEIVRGYKVTAIFDKNKIESYFKGSSPITKINFYAKSDSGTLIDTKTIDFADTEEYTTYFFLDNGTDYATVDNDLRRGNSYTFSYDLVIDEDGNADTDDLVFPSNRPTSDRVTPVKQEPLFKLYIDNSSANSISYKYKIYDYDNALYMEDGKYYVHYSISGSDEEYLTEIYKDDNNNSFTLSNLTNGDIYNISYYGAVQKKIDPMVVSIGNYYFDGYYDANDYNLGYRLEYGNFDNRLKVIVDDNEFLNRVSAYLLTLTAGSDKYQMVVTNLSSCDTSDPEVKNKCIILDYEKIAAFKGKDITVALEAFYDTGYIGFGQVSRLGSYFEGLGFVDSANANKVGFIYQTTGNSAAGKYFGIKNGNYTSVSDTPSGILGFDFKASDNFKAIWKLDTSSLVDDSNSSFTSFGNIILKGSSTISTSGGSISIINKNMTVNPKVLDKVNIQTDDDNFKFTSITPKVKASVKALINGAVMNIELSRDPETFESEFVKTDGKYKFYVDIYKECSEEEGCTNGLSLVKTVETDYDSLGEVTFTGLDPNTKYIYKISADMNKNGTKVKTPLFDYNRGGYVEFKSEFNTLSEDKIFNRVTYGYTSSITDDTYSSRVITFTTYLKTSTNFDVKYQLYDNDGNLEFEDVISNDNISVSDSVITAKYAHDISGNDFVFGAGYHNLVITAVTTDLGRELVLYNDKLIYDDVNGKNFKELDNPTFTLTQSPYTDSVNDEYNYGIMYEITVTDVDKVINGGIYHVELQNSAYNNACSGHEDDCRVTVNIKANTCKFDNGSTSGCSIISRNKDSQKISIKFDNLVSDTNYVIYVYANTYRNNLSLSEKEGLVYVRKSQYTNSPLNFSLGAVTPTATSKNELNITFVGSSNLTDSLKGIDYSITVQGGEKVASGSLGKTDTTSGKLDFHEDKDGYPYIKITTDKQLGLNNYIIITYYYEDSNGNLVKLKIGEDTSYQYTVKNES